MTWVANVTGYAFVQPIVPAALPNLGAAFVVGLLPVLLVLVLLGVFHLPAWLSACSGLVLTFVIAIPVWGMPARLAFYSFGTGVVFASWSVCWIVFHAMALFNLAVHTGHFDGFRRSLVHFVPNDKRVYLILIGFCLGALIEGVSGFGSTIAICSSMLVNLGFEPLHALTISLIFDTTPVAFGALGVPVTTLAAVTGLPTMSLSAMQGRQLPFVGFFLPLYVQFFYSGWSGIRDTWPVCLISGVSFAVLEFAVSNYLGPQLPDVIASLGSLIITMLFVRVWNPPNSHLWRASPPIHHHQGVVEVLAHSGTGDNDVALETDPEATAEAASAKPEEAAASTTAAAAEPEKKKSFFATVFSSAPPSKPDNDLPPPPQTLEELEALFGARPTVLQTVLAWAPWILVAAWVIGWTEAGVPAMHQDVVTWYGLDKQIYISAYDSTPSAAVYAAKYTWQPLGTGTAILCSVLTTWVLYCATGSKPALIVRAYIDTVRQLYLAIFTVVVIIGMAYVLNYSGMAYSLGLGLSSLGNAFAFLSPFLGWIACFLSGSDTSSNTLFGNLQKLAAQTIGLNRVLICVSNSTGAVMAKMVSIQNVTTGVTT
ncbi:hypothetical protein HK405_011258, partial [Cladochytrium tenue]